MSDSHAKAPEVLDENGDELIHVPKGQSRLRYLATIALVLFLLVIFVVADLFQSTLTGGGSREDGVYVTWKDPVDGSQVSVKQSDFQNTQQFLGMLATGTGGIAYAPPSMVFRDPALPRLKRIEVEDEDVASFLVYEELAKDSGIAVSDQEHKDFLKAIFGSNANLAGFANQAGMSSLALSEGIRRVQRVTKLQRLILSTQGIPDSEAAVAQWQEDQPEYEFDVVSVGAEQFDAQARTEVPSDEELLEWFHARPPFEQQRLFTQPRVVYEVAYVDLDADEPFDGSALLAAYPMADDADVEQLTRSYYDLNQRLRFMKPAAEPEDGDGDDQDPDSAEPQEAKKPEATEPYPFEEVQDRARTEAELYAAMQVLLTELQDAQTAGEEVDLIARAAELGLASDRGADEGVTRAEIPEIEGWGSTNISGQLSFAAEGTFVPRVVLSEGAMAIAKVTRKIAAEEPPFADIRDDVVDMWAKERSSELAKEALDNLRATLVPKPDDVEVADWKPVIDKAALQQLATEAQYEFYDRPATGRGAMPPTPNDADRFLRTQADIYDLEPGQVGAAKVSFDKTKAYLVRLDSKVQKPVDDIDVAAYEGYSQRTVTEHRREVGARIFMGDSEWLTSTTGLRYPVRERIEQERAAGENAEG